MADLPPALRSLLRLPAPEPLPPPATLPPVPGEEHLLAALLATPPSVPAELAEILRRADQDRQVAALLASYEKVRDGMRSGFADGNMTRFLGALDALRGSP